MLPETLADALADIATNNLNGASWLVSEAGKAVAEHAAGADADALRELIPDLAQALAATQPSMAPFWNFANDLALAAEQTEDAELPNAVAETCEAYHHGTAQRLAAIAKLAEGTLSGYGRIATHSLSHTVISAVTRLHEGGTLQRVYCTAGEPVQEGRAVAGALAGDGVPITFTTDAGIYPLLAEVDALVVGGDAVSADGLRNKTGTFGLAAAAVHLRKPVYALCDPTKFLPVAFARDMPEVRHEPD